MAKLSSYATVSTLLEAMYFYTAIDTDLDGTYESRKVTFASIRAALEPASGIRAIMLPAAPDAITDSAACSVANYFTTLTTTAAAVPTLADGVHGQVKKIQMIVDAGNAVLTPTNLTGGTTITFADVGDVAELMFNSGSWQVMALYNVVDGSTAPVLA